MMNGAQERRVSTRIHYITMSFPNRVEVFAANDIRALLAEGAELCVHSMRRRDPEAGNLLSQFALTDVGLTHNTWRSSLAGLRLLLTDHGYRSAAGKLLRLPGYGARELAKTLTILPRAVAITETIRRERPDIVHLFWGHYPSLVGALVQSSLPEVPLSMFLGAYDLEREYPPSKLVASQAAVVWTHAAANVPALLQLGVAAEKVRVAYRGLDHSRMPERGPKVPGRIVSAGRLIPAKRMDAVIEAFERILSAQPQATLEILGDGPERGRLERRCASLGIGERVRFRGHLPHAEVLATMAQAEVFLFLSDKASERLPNVVKEAMACGCACVASSTTAMEELIPSDDHGLLVEPGNADEAATAVLRLFSEPECRARMTTTARKHIRDNFDVRVSMRSYLRTWVGLAKDRAEIRALGRCPRLHRWARYEDHLPPPVLQDAIHERWNALLRAGAPPRLAGTRSTW